MLARLQQVITLSALACALGWWVWMWPRSPVLALAGALFMTLGFSIVLALEFVILSRVGLGDPVPPARWLELAGAWAAETLVALQVFCWRQPFRWRALPDEVTGDDLRGRTGVVFIHGFVCNRGFWAPWLRQMRARRRAFIAVNLEPVFTSIDDYVPIVEAAVRRMREATGRPPVLVCHSMGGLVARAWLRARDNADAVAHVVTIGSPHHGTWLARFNHLPSGLQMRQDSAWIRDLRIAWNLQRGERFTCWYSNCDNIVMPPSTATLPGADNRLVRGAAHVGLAFRPEVMAATWALLDEGAKYPSASDQA